MLIIDTILKETTNKGIGLFTNEDLNKDKVISITSKIFNKFYTYKCYNKMNKVNKIFLDTYGIFKDNGIYLDLDNLRFMNHSNDPNIQFNDRFGFAMKNIKKGEELTCNYIELEGKLDFISYE